ncbi:MAG TPA: bestrophin family ion channel, partial [Luteitalea sp.]|nr:bestrophin family ion channel [Luteitalea sp.]
MIVRDRLPLRRVWPSVSRRLGFLFLFDLTIAVLYTKAGVSALSLPSLPLGMMGAALSVFLAFRNNSAYDRWWEACTLWGALVNDSRSWARQAVSFIDEGHPPRADGESRETVSRRLIEWQIAFVHALRCHLRNQNAFPEMGDLIDADAVRWLRTQSNVPLGLLAMMGRELGALRQRGAISDYRFVKMDESLTRLCAIQGGCERIKNTPLPRQYEFFPRVFVATYCILLPFGLVEGLGLLTPLASTLASFIFLALESIGREIEAPFELTVHDTPLTQL